MRLSTLVSLLAVAVLTSCSPTHAPATSPGTPLPAAPSPSSPSTTTSSSQESAPVASSPASPPVVWSNGATSTPRPGSRLGLDETSRREALWRAGHGMGVFARPGLTAGLWWADLQPLLSAQASLAYATVDPASIEVQQVTGAAYLAEWVTPEVARVSVPTDVGVYLVVVSRSDADPVWRIERFIAPEVTS